MARISRQAKQYLYECGNDPDRWFSYLNHVRERLEQGDWTRRFAERELAEIVDDARRGLARAASIATPDTRKEVEDFFERILSDLSVISETHSLTLPSNSGTGDDKAPRRRR